MADLLTGKAVDELRASLSDKLEELHRRASTAAKLLAPSTYWNDPIVRFGLGVAIGLAIGGRGKSGDREGLLYSMVRAGLTATTSALITRALTRSEPAAAEPAEPTEPAR